MIIKKTSQDIFAESLKELLNDYPFEKITVQDITDNCNLSRTTFYRNFKDKYDLMTWIYYRKVQTFIDSHADISSARWDEVSKLVIDFFKENASFFAAVLKFKGQNSFEEFWYNYCCEYCYEHIRKITGCNTISPKDRIVVKIHIGGTMCALFEWVKGGCYESVDEMLQVIGDCMPKPIEPYFMKNEKNS